MVTWRQFLTKDSSPSDLNKGNPVAHSSKVEEIFHTISPQRSRRPPKTYLLVVWHNDFSKLVIISWHHDFHHQRYYSSTTKKLYIHYLIEAIKVRTFRPWFNMVTISIELILAIIGILLNIAPALVATLTLWEYGRRRIYRNRHHGWRSSSI